MQSQPTNGRRPTTEQLLAHLAARGHRLTGPRREIVAALAQRGNTTAQELCETMQAAGQSVGRATVFRTLELLSQLELVERVHLPDGCHTYVLAQPGHRHHLICTACGAMVEFSDCALDEALAELARRTAFYINDHWLEVFGLCQPCQARRAAPA